MMQLHFRRPGRSLPPGSDPNRLREFVDKQNAVMRPLLPALRSCVPRHWREAALVMETDSGGPPEKRSIRHRVTNPATREEANDFTESLFLSTAQLHAVFADYQAPGIRATITTTYDAAGKQGPSKGSFAYH